MRRVDATEAGSPRGTVILAVLSAITRTRLGFATSTYSKRVFGSPDDLKFRFSMTLFALCVKEPQPYRDALDKYFDGEADPLTV